MSEKKTYIIVFNWDPFKDLKNINSFNRLFGMSYPDHMISAKDAILRGLIKLGAELESKNLLDKIDLNSLHDLGRNNPAIAVNMCPSLLREINQLDFVETVFCEKSAELMDQQKFKKRKFPFSHTVQMPL